MSELARRLRQGAQLFSQQVDHIAEEVARLQQLLDEAGALHAKMRAERDAARSEVVQLQAQLAHMRTMH